MAAADFQVRHQVVIVGSEDSDEKRVGFKRSDRTVTEVTRTDVTEAHAETREVAASATDEALAFGGVGQAKILYMECDAALTMKLNGGSEVFNLTPQSGMRAKLLWDGSFDSISITNPSSTAAVTLTYFIAS
jgi:hypothetical protein